MPCKARGVVSGASDKRSGTSDRSPLPFHHLARRLFSFFLFRRRRLLARATASTRHSPLFSCRIVLIWPFACRSPQWRIGDGVYRTYAVALRRFRPWLAWNTDEWRSLLFATLRSCLPTLLSEEEKWQNDTVGLGSRVGFDLTSPGTAVNAPTVRTRL
ncbi:hypothetical protein BRADI_4g36405v3 [Brachypodium distachyon]|uniref:Uncharacterized protein n=1 Tax=Brachypodium distachyon TaxID=15368 RepID=A0A2K2CSL3_BRADI|nr:hypothetical protein BRADI_4g36405v3 [Brachypodium distachyon]